MSTKIELLFCNLINHPDNEEAKAEFSSRLKDDVELAWGSGVQAKSKADVMNELAHMAKALSSPEGFTAEHVYVLGCDIPEYDCPNGSMYDAVALYSKLEDYSSWTFVFFEDDEEKITAIRGAMSNNFCLYKCPPKE